VRAAKTADMRAARMPAGQLPTPAGARYV